MSVLHGITKLVLVDPNPAVAEAFSLHFEDEPLAEVVNDRFENLSCFDCIVSPANSFGLMDGGVDMAITRFFGFELMDAVQSRIVREYFGEQPVGTCMVVETGHAEHPYLAHTPTMRVPMDIRGTDNVYLAMFAMLRAVALHNGSSDVRRIEVVACPGLGTLTGRMSPSEAARQMHLAVDSLRHPITNISWIAAERRAANVRPRA